MNILCSLSFCLSFNAKLLLIDKHQNGEAPREFSPFTFNKKRKPSRKLLKKIERPDYMLRVLDITCLAILNELNCERWFAKLFLGPQLKKSKTEVEDFIQIALPCLSQLLTYLSNGQYPTNPQILARIAYILKKLPPSNARGFPSKVVNRVSETKVSIRKGVLIMKNL
jgi:hypothetical protein